MKASQIWLKTTSITTLSSHRLYSGSCRRGNLFWIIMPLVNLFFSHVILHDICNYSPLKTTFCKSEHNCIDIFDPLFPKCHFHSALKSCLYTHYKQRPLLQQCWYCICPPCLFMFAVVCNKMHMDWLMLILEGLEDQNSGWKLRHQR